MDVRYRFGQDRLVVSTRDAYVPSGKGMIGLVVLKLGRSDPRCADHRFSTPSSWALSGRRERARAQSFPLLYHGRHRRDDHAHWG